MLGHQDKLNEYPELTLTAVTNNRVLKPWKQLIGIYENSGYW